MNEMIKRKGGGKEGKEGKEEGKGKKNKYFFSF